MSKELKIAHTEKRDNRRRNRKVDLLIDDATWRELTEFCAENGHNLNQFLVISVKQNMNWHQEALMMRKNPYLF